MGRYPRRGSGWGEAFSHGLLPYPPFAQTTSMTWWTLIQVILLVAGIVVTARLHTLLRRPDPVDDLADEAHLDIDGREIETIRLMDRKEAAPMPAWPLVSYLILAVLTGLAYAPDSALRTFLLAPWYKDGRRIMGVEDIALAVLMAVGVAAIVHGIHAAWAVSLRRILAERSIEDDVEDDVEAPRWPIQVGILSLVVLLSGFGAIDARDSAVAYVYDPTRLASPAWPSRANSPCCAACSTRQPPTPRRRRPHRGCRLFGAAGRPQGRFPPAQHGQRRRGFAEGPHSALP